MSVSVWLLTDVPVVNDVVAAVVLLDSLLVLSLMVVSVVTDVTAVGKLVADAMLGTSVEVCVSAAGSALIQVHDCVPEPERTTSDSGERDAHERNGMQS
jgi:hypothetical protein